MQLDCELRPLHGCARGSATIQPAIWTGELEHRVLGSGPPGLWESWPHGKIKVDSGYRTFALGQSLGVGRTDG